MFKKTMFRFFNFLRTNCPICFKNCPANYENLKKQYNYNEAQDKNSHRSSVHFVYSIFLEIFYLKIYLLLLCP